MDSFDLLSIPRFMGNDNNFDDINHKNDFNKSKAISKLVYESKERQKQRNTSIVDNISEENMSDIKINNENEEQIEPMVETNEEFVENNSEVNTNLDSNDFQVIGEVKKQNMKKVTKITSKWMTKPINFDRDIKNTKSLDHFRDVIDDSMIDLLLSNQINHLFPVQQQVIPYLSKCFNNSHLIRPKDVCVCSPTGSGKTLSFVIPIVQYLKKRVVTNVRVLVVLPVRDLAVQVFNVFHKYCGKSSLKVGLIVGHKSLTEESNSLVRKSIDGSKYESLVDILVATPGKLVDLIQRVPGFSLRHLEILVLDESDRMVNELQFNWYHEIESSVFAQNRKYHCFCSIGADNDESYDRYNVDSECLCDNWQSLNAKPIHKILFSATLSTDPEKIKFISLFNPILFMVSSVSSDTNSKTSEDICLETSKKHLIPNELQEFMIISKVDKKPLIICYLIEVLKYRKVLCFTSSVESSHRLYSLLKQMSDIVVAEYSSKLSDKKREKLLNKFIDQKIDLIVCSDIFARGLDIDAVNYVVCYDPPRNETQYIHRIGRTARAGNKGTAITLLTPLQLSHFNIISRRVHEKNPNDKNELIIKKMIIKDSHLKPLMSKYKNGLQTLYKHIKYEEKKKLILKRNFKH